MSSCSCFVLRPQPPKYVPSAVLLAHRRLRSSLGIAYQHVAGDGADLEREEDSEFGRFDPAVHVLPSGLGAATCSSESAELTSMVQTVSQMDTLDSTGVKSGGVAGKTKKYARLNGMPLGLQLLVCSSQASQCINYDEFQVRSSCRVRR